MAQIKLINEVKFDLRAALFIALLLLLNGFTMLVLQASLNRAAVLQDDLVKERHSISDLEGTLLQVTQELEELQLLYDELLEEKEELERSRGRRGAAGGSGPTAYLTIDDGPSKNTILMLEILAEYDIPATFFVIGNNMSGDENIYSRIVEEGHALGNHTYYHNLRTLYNSTETFMADLMRLEDHLYRVAGVRPDIVRFPGGTSNTVGRVVVIQDIIRTLLDRGYDYFDWNVSSGDANSSLTPGKLVENVTTQVDRLGGRDAVILLHDTYLNYNSVQALPRIIEELLARGYQFAPLTKGAVNSKHR